MTSSSSKWIEKRKMLAARPQHCERCSKAIVGAEVTWSNGRYNGMPCITPYCADCASLLRIFAGGVGAAGEPMESASDDRTPAHKEDY
jgi:hypothetical protein